MRWCPWRRLYRTDVHPHGDAWGVETPVYPYTRHALMFMAAAPVSNRSGRTGVSIHIAHNDALAAAPASNRYGRTGVSAHIAHNDVRPGFHVYSDDRCRFIVGGKTP